MTTQDLKINRKLLWALIVVFILGWMAVDMNKYVRRLPRMNGSLKRWLPLTKMMDLGPELYNKRKDYLYPPIFLIILKPLADVPMPLQAIIYELAKQLSLIVSIILGWNIVKNSVGQPRLILLFIAIILAGRYFQSDLSHGNVNIFLFFFVILGCWLWQNDRQLLAGLPIALAISIKVTPLLLLFYGAYKRQWRLVIGGLIGIFLFIWLIPALYMGWSANQDFLRGWFFHVIVPFSSALNIDAIHTNQSLSGTLLRYLTDTMAMDKPLRYINLASLDRKTVMIVYRICVIVLAAIAWWGIKGKIGDRKTPAFIYHLSILFLLMVLLSGYSWHAHFVYLFIPYLTLLTTWDRLTPETPAKKRLLIAIGASYFLGTAMTSAFGPFLSDLFDSYGVLTAACILLLITSVIMGNKVEKTPDIFQKQNELPPQNEEINKTLSA